MGGEQNGVRLVINTKNPLTKHQINLYDVNSGRKIEKVVAYTISVGESLYPLITYTTRDAMGIETTRTATWVGLETCKK